MKVIFSSKAEGDLATKFRYIRDDLHNPVAANNVVGKILRLSQELSHFPELGVSLKAVDAALATYRYLIADNNLLVYRIEDQKVFIVRVLYARSDYVRLLQG